MFVEAKMEGTDQIAAAIRSKLLKTSAAIGTVTIGVVAGGSRGSAKNSLIAQVQAARKRNPWYLDRDTMTAIRFVLRGVGAEDADIPGILRRIGGFMVDGVRNHVEQMKNANGSTFAELSARYAAFKRRKYGYIHPILSASKDLLNGLRAVVTRQ
jgi:hypothetical protein